MIRLADIRDSLEGVIPSIVATTDASGMPNVSYLSHVYYVDGGHIALSNQFFSKTATNVRETGRASVMVVDGRTGVQHVLEVRPVRSETEGPLFERMSSHLEVLEGGGERGGVMRLHAADIYAVDDIREVVPVAPLEEPAPAADDARDHLGLAARLVGDLAALDDTEAVLDLALDRLRGLFGYSNIQVLVADPAGGLSTIASIGYDRHGYGAEAASEAGAIAVAARSRQPIRLSDAERGQRYASAVRSSAAMPSAPDIPFPKLAGARSQLAVPMLSRNRLVGVLFCEASRSYAFSQSDEDAVRIVAAQLAVILDTAEPDRAEAQSPPLHGADMPAGDAAAAGHGAFRVRFFSHDGSLFLDDDYVIRGVPGRVLMHLLQVHAATGRTVFSNREIRREKALQLPDFKDNLETRLIMLRRRLDEKAMPVRLSRPERGQIRLEMSGRPVVEVVEG